MKKTKKTSDEGGRILSRVDKKNIMSGFLFKLLQNANIVIDSGKFDSEFCLHCVLEDAVAFENIETSVHKSKVLEDGHSIKGRFTDYEIGNYLHDDYISKNEAPVSGFQINRFLDDQKFDVPVNGRASIEYPFDDVVYEFNIVNAKSVGEILSQISDAYEVAFNCAENDGFGYYHEIEELVFESNIRVYDNGEIEFYIGS